MDRKDIPPFLVDLQALVAALRDGREWDLSPRLREQPQLVLDYVSEGPGRAAVAAALKQA